MRPKLHLNDGGLGRGGSSRRVSPNGLRESAALTVFNYKNVPAQMRNSLDKAKLLAMYNEVAQEKLAFFKEHKRKAGPSEILLMHQAVLSRAQHGFSYVDFLRGAVADHRIERATLSLDPARHQDKVFNPVSVKLSELSIGDGGSDTHGGGTSDDLAPVTSFVDDSIHGETGGVIPPMMLAEMMMKHSRSISLLPLARIGFAPDLTFQQPLRTNTIYDELFEGTHLANLKATVLPREEGDAGTAEFRPKYSKADYSCRGYMFHSTLTAELLSSKAEGILGIEQDTISMLGEAPGAVGEYDLITGLFYGSFYGYKRMYDADTDSWNTNVTEVPFGKAGFINANAVKHWRFFHPHTGQFFMPSADANYFKWGNRQADSSNLFDSTGNKIIDAIKYLAYLQSEKRRKLEAVFLDRWSVVKMSNDDRFESMWYDSGASRFSGEPGYAGRINILGTNEATDVFLVDTGCIPTFQTADSKNIAHWIMGGELGKAMTYAPYWPVTLMVDKEYKIVERPSGSGRNVTRPNLNNVLTSYSMEAVEPMDVEALSHILVMNETL